MCIAAPATRGDSVPRAEPLLRSLCQEQTRAAEPQPQDVVIQGRADQPEIRVKDGDPGLARRGDRGDGEPSAGQVRRHPMQRTGPGDEARQPDLPETGTGGRAEPEALRVRGRRNR
jgi:hypothetical protein